MNARFRVVLAGAALCGGMCYVAGTCVAQTQVAPQLPISAGDAKEDKITREIVIKNVLPSVMAWWLDPKNHPTPVQFQTAEHPKSADINAALEPVSAWLQGVDRLIAIDPQNILLVSGTPAGVAEIKKMVAFFDKPLRHVEVQAQFVTVQPQKLGEFGIQFGDSNAVPNGDTSRMQLGFVRSNFQATLSKLVAQNQAKIITAPRVTAINNLTANLDSFSPLPGTLGLKDEAGKFTSLGSSIGTHLHLGVTPTINNDDTVTILMSTAITLQLSGDTGKNFISAPDPGVESIINARDGDTIALVGYKPRFLPAPNSEPQTSVPNLVIFVTTRIVRRAENDAKTVALTR